MKSTSATGKQASSEAPISLNRRAWLASAAASGLACCGCPSPNAEQTPLPAAKPATLRLAVIDDEPLAEAIQQQWKARAESELKITNLTLEQAAKRKTLSTDAVIYPSAMLGELIGKKWVMPMDARLLDNHTLDRSQVFELIRLRETNWEDGVYGIPLGGPVFTVAWRTDLHASSPQTWTEYAQAVDAVQESGANGVLGALEPLAGHWAAEVFLARAAAYARRRDTLATLFDSRSMDPLLNLPPFQRALRELAENAKQAPQCLDMTPPDTAAAMLNRESSLAITWLSHETQGEGGNLPIAFAELPGSKDIYDRRKQQWGERRKDDPGRVTLLGVAGRMGSVTRLSSQPAEAANRLMLLSSADWSRRISPKSSATAPFRKKHLAYANAWCEQLGSSLADSYAAATESSLSRKDWLFSPRIPGRQQYLEALSRAVRSAAKGEKQVKPALDEACDDWREITTSLSLNDQRDAYSGSLVR